jgi:hypothetical protein
MALPLGLNPTAPGRGAIVIEIAGFRDDLRELFTEMNCVQALALHPWLKEVTHACGPGHTQKF